MKHPLIMFCRFKKGPNHRHEHMRFNEIRQKHLQENGTAGRIGHITGKNGSQWGTMQTGEPKCRGRGGSDKRTRRANQEGIVHR